MTTPASSEMIAAVPPVTNCDAQPVDVLLSARVVSVQDRIRMLNTVNFPPNLSKAASVVKRFSASSASTTSVPLEPTRMLELVC